MSKEDKQSRLDYYSTKLTHPDSFEPMKGASNPPVYHTSTILFDTLEEFRNSEQRHAERGQSSYGIYGNTASYMLEELLAEMEGGKNCVLTSSGLSAITLAINALVRSGDHILISDSAYEPTQSFVKNFLKENTIEVDYFPPNIGSDIKDFIKANTKLIFLESPGSITFEIHDTPAICKVAQEHGIFTAMDNTWASPLYQTPLALGVDISIHAVSKYIAGHSDLLMGAIICNDRTSKLMKRFSKIFGNHVASDDVYLALRGLRTMPQRLRVHESSAIQVANWLEQDDIREKYNIGKVYHPALASHPQHELFKRDFMGSTGLFSFSLSNITQVQLANMMNELKLFGMGFSWGGYQSLLIPTALQSHRHYAPDLPDNTTLMRLYTGLEHTPDLMADLEAGFKRLFD